MSCEQIYGRKVAVNHLFFIKLSVAIMLPVYDI